MVAPPPPYLFVVLFAYQVSHRFGHYIANFVVLLWLETECTHFTRPQTRMRAMKHKTILLTLAEIHFSHYLAQ